jgi:hypothetical protein
MKLFTLEQLAEQSVKREIETFQLVEQYKQTVNLSNVASNLWYENEKIGVYELVYNKNTSRSKIRFFLCGWLDEYSILSSNSRLLDYGLNHISYALLSDNESVIQRYANLRYQRGANAELSMDEMIAGGESPVWCNTVQMFMSNNSEGVARNLDILERLTIPKLSNKEKELRLDFAFYKALYAGNKGEMENILTELVSPKVHKKRNEDAVLNQYISHPASGYVKLAWRYGFEVEINSSLIPRLLLPVRPLETYEVPYGFLAR